MALTLTAGPRAPVGVDFGSIHVDQNTGALQVFNGQRFAAPTLGGVTILSGGQILAADGAGGGVGAPTYSFDGDPNTGMYSAGVDQIGFTTGGADRFLVRGVGADLGTAANRSTTNPTNALNIYDGTAPVGTLANGVTLYAQAGKLWAMDAAGNATQLTP